MGGRVRERVREDYYSQEADTGKRALMFFLGVLLIKTTNIQTKEEKPQVVAKRDKISVP